MRKLANVRVSVGAILTWVSLFSGCADGQRFDASQAKEVAGSALATSEPASDRYQAPASAPVSAADNPSSKTNSAPRAERKIVYNASVDLVVETMGSIGEKISKLVGESGGYVADSNESSQSSAQRHATWQVRVPVEKFAAFLNKVTSFGELQQSRVNSKDVSEEYYDLAARIKNKSEEEKRLLKHLADSTGKLEDILAVEKELTRVRGEIEQMEGRIRYLSDVSSMSTITINVTEIKNYVAPITPTFGMQIQRTFAESGTKMLDFCKWVVLLIVAILPWLPFIVVSLIVLIFALSMHWKYRYLSVQAPGSPRTG